MKITTTLNRIKEKTPCEPGWDKLLTFLGKTKADDEELDLLTILESNGVKDCIWAFRCTDDNDSIYRHMAADFAESVLHLFEEKHPKDTRPRLAIQAARDYADGKIDWAAAYSATGSADSAASSVDWAASSDYSAACSAYWAASSAASWDYSAASSADSAARSADFSAASSSELEKQKAIIIKYLS